MRSELMRNPIPPTGVKVPALIPCNYLDTYVFDGRCEYLDTASVLDSGNRESRLKKMESSKHVHYSEESYPEVIALLMYYDNLYFHCQNW